MTSTTFPWFIASMNPRTGFRCKARWLNRRIHTSWLHELSVYWGVMEKEIAGFLLETLTNLTIQKSRVTKVKSTLREELTMLHRKEKSFCRTADYWDLAVQPNIGNKQYSCTLSVLTQLHLKIRLQVVLKLILNKLRLYWNVQVLLTNYKLLNHRVRESELLKHLSSTKIINWRRY